MSETSGGSGPCVAALELASIAVGFEVVDGICKEADVLLLLARPVSPGKFVVLFSGAVEDVTASLRRGLELGGDVLIDRLFIPDIEPTLLALVRGGRPPGPELDALGVIETLSVSSTVHAGDIAAKTSSITLVSLGLAVGIGGKSYVTFTGEVSAVNASVDAGADHAQAAGMLVRRVVIPRPHAALPAVLAASGRPALGGTP